MNKLVSLGLVLVISLSLAGCKPKQEEVKTSSNQGGEAYSYSESTGQNSQEKSKVKQYNTSPGKLSDDQITGKIAEIKTNKGTIRFKFFPEEAPLTVSNFIFLSQEKFYDGLTFHRVEPGFVVQGGDPLGNGTGGPGYQFEDEKVSRSYTKGIVAMANSGPNTNGSQFFIMLEDTPLPPQYTIFGEVVDGQDVVDQIEVGDTMETVTIVNE